jgi:hypothetical protein
VEKISIETKVHDKHASSRSKMKIPFDLPLRIITPCRQPQFNSRALWVTIANLWLCHTRPKWFTENEISLASETVCCR